MMSRRASYRVGQIAALAMVPATGFAQSMVEPTDGYAVEPIFTIGESIGDYTPPGVLDGLGAYRMGPQVVRVFANHELQNNRGYPYEVGDGQGGTYTLTGSRVSYFDIHRGSRRVIGAGLAYDVIYAHDGQIATDASFLANDFGGLSRLCSSALFEARQFRGAYPDGFPGQAGDDVSEMVDGLHGFFGRGRRGLEDRIYFTGEEDGGGFNAVGGNEWALDPETRSLWAVPALGRGAWENVTEVDTGRTNMVAILLSDDTSPFDADPAAGNGAEAAPL
ncbi:MAG: hypothetical protein KDA28_07920, partial [Phycisphaerales bacterium]|nr:hypothetical protein [Phycisphaerales bacterium]